VNKQVNREMSDKTRNEWQIYPTILYNFSLYNLIYIPF